MDRPSAAAGMCLELANPPPPSPSPEPLARDELVKELDPVLAASRAGRTGLGAEIRGNGSKYSLVAHPHISAEATRGRSNIKPGFSNRVTTKLTSNSLCKFCLL